MSKDKKLTDLSFELVSIHFDVENNYLPLRTFTQTVSNAELIAAEISRKYYNIGCDVAIFPAERGSFIVSIAFIAGGLLCIVKDPAVHFLRKLADESIDKLSGHNCEYWGEQARNFILNKLDRYGKNPDNVKVDELVEVRKHSLILAECTKNFLSWDSEKLCDIGVTPQNSRDVYAAKNTFYKSIEDVSEIRGIGFDNSETFPIKRPDFANLYVDLPTEEESSTLLGELEMEVTTVIVTSPNWKMDDKRKWKGKDQDNRDCTFMIDDIGFWALVKDRQIKPLIMDKIEVQWVFRRSIKNNRQKIVAIKVLKFNDQHLSEPYSGECLTAKIGYYKQKITKSVDSSQGQKNLFDELP